MPNPPPPNPDDPLGQFAEVFDGPAFVLDEKWIGFESGQLDLGIVHFVPSRWHPIARWRQQRRRRRANNDYSTFLEVWETSPSVIRGSADAIRGVHHVENSERGGIRLVDPDSNTP